MKKYSKSNTPGFTGGLPILIKVIKIVVYAELLKNLGENMKKVVFIALFSFVLTPMFSQNLMTLDSAINDYANGLMNNIQRERGVAVIAFETDRRILMEYFIDTMTEKLWEKGIRPIFERRRLEILQSELNYSLSGEVSDETAQRIGQRAGVNTLIYGSLQRIGNNNYRIIIRATNVETAQLVFPKSYDLQLDSRLAGLLGISESARADERRNTPAAPAPPAQLPPNTSRPAATTVKKGGIGVWGYGFLNLAFGLGSFMQKDTKGGLTLAGGYAAFAGLLAWELSLSYDDGLAGVPGAFGLTALAATVAYSFIRPNIYNKKRVSAGFMDGVDIALVPGYRGGDAVRVSYTVHF